jgi:hypothetical protein
MTTYISGKVKSGSYDSKWYTVRNLKPVFLNVNSVILSFHTHVVYQHQCYFRTVHLYHKAECQILKFGAVVNLGQ